MPEHPPAEAVPADDLRWRCDPDIFATISPSTESTAALIGQPGAIEALELGLEMDAPGYNIFVCGPSGTGKMSTVRSLLRGGARRRGPLRDYAYVQNFDDPDQPLLLAMPAGEGRRFRRAFEAFVDELTEQVRRRLEDESVEDARRARINECEVLERDLLSDFEERCGSLRFALVQMQIGDAQHIDVMPIYKREPIDIEELNEIARSKRGRVPKLDETNERHAELKEELRVILTQLRQAARAAHEDVTEIEATAVHEGLLEPLSDLKERFPHDGVGEWLDSVADWVADNVDFFNEDDEQPTDDAPLRCLRVNIVLDNAARTEPPVVFENFPTFTNLLGTVERPSDEARPTVDFTDVKGGSLLRADGGVLVLNANDAVAESGVWRCLSRFLKTRELEIQSPEQYFSQGSASALKPQPIPVDVKVIAVGDDELYRALYLGTDDFRRIFKLKADFDDVMPREDENLAIYARHTWRVVAEEGLRPASNSALARIAEFGVRLAGRQDRLSARFSDLTDVLREAAHYASVDDASETSRAHVERALDARLRRHSMSRERLRDLIRSGVIELSTDGGRVGIANALTVLDLGDSVVGQPCRISATIAPGHEGVVSVEREVRLSGRLHDKGTLILIAYLRAHYLPDAVLSLSATVAFEQLHDEVDGDSAALAETIALLSALTGVPVDQGIAMTGAVDQMGCIQAVGGLSQKLESFFDLCDERGLTGRQGVIVPAANHADLVLAERVVSAVREGRFKIWKARHVDQVIRLVCGMPAGARDEEGQFPPHSLNARVRAALRRLNELSGPPPGRR